jgi:NAD+ diphosphatase
MGRWHPSHVMQLCVEFVTEFRHICGPCHFARRHAGQGSNKWGGGMQAFEGLAFAGSGLDRAAHLRKDAGRVAELLIKGRVLPLWRGKPLVEGSALVWVRSDSAVLAHAGAPVFLGLDEGTACFASDISDWSPEAGADAVEQGFFDSSEQRHPAGPAQSAFVELRGVMTALSLREGELVATAKAVLHWHRSHAFCATCGAATVAEAAGWQRGCPACGAHHFPRTDPVVIMLVTRGNRLLLGRSPGWPEGMYSCLAGFVEPGETIDNAVRREVAEETGVQVGAVRVIATQPWPFPASLMIGCLAEATSDEITCDPDEIEDALWLTREDLVRVFGDTHPVVRPPRRGAIAQSLIENWLADRLE